MKATAVAAKDRTYIINGLHRVNIGWLLDMREAGNAWFAWTKTPCIVQHIKLTQHAVSVF